MSNDTAIISLKEKIDDLNQQAWEVRVSDMPKAFELSQESVKLARSINYPKGLAEGLRLLGFSYLRFSKNDEAALLLKESLSLFQSLNDLSGQAIVYEYLGIIERNRGNLGTSLELLLKGNGLIQQTSPPEIELTSCYQIGVTYKHLGNHENALDYLYKTLSLAKKINYPLMEAYATNIIGSIYFDNGNYDQALDCYQQGLPIRRQSNDKWGEAGSLDNIGFTYLKLNDLDKAIDYCKQSLAICQATGDKKGEANALLHLGEIYKQAGDIKQAADFSNKSLEIRKERGDKRGETEVLLFLAELYKNRNDVEDHQIFEWLSNALKIADEVKAQDLLSKTYYDLHEYYQQKGNFKESLVQLEAHFQIEKELHKNSINQKIANLEISHKAEAISQRNKELTELNEKIEKANEEAQIQLALERVRARTMAMQHSDELKDAASLLFKQLEDLGVKSWSSGFNIWEDDGRSAIINMCNPDGSIATPYHLPHTEEIFFIKIDEARQRGDELLVMETGGKDLEQTYNYMFSLPEVKKMLGGMEDTGFQIPKFQVSHCAFFSQGYLMFITYEPVPKMWDVFKRLAKVFEQTYTRFLDLQKAEAQARESQIQLALERVRARTMAMQRSDELREAVLVIYEQLQQLNFESRACNIIIIDKESGSAQYWVSGFSQEIFPESYNVPYLDHPYQDALLNPWKQGDMYVVYEYTGQMKQSFDKLFFTQTEFRNVPVEAKKVMIGLESVTLSTAFFVYGALQTLGVEPLSEEKANILKRFAKVFEQTYTRFLDLQKAEAQAREAQIEAALERVRSRSMGMQKSEELKEVIQIVYEQFVQLNINVEHTGFVMDYKARDDYDIWIADQLGVPSHVIIPYFDCVYYNRFNEAKKKGEDFFATNLDFEEKNRFYQKIIEYVPGLPEETKDFLFRIPGLAGSTVLLENVGLYIENFAGTPFSDEENKILMRFGKVFQQTYTRFLDLQKAEAQAREAQIEAALEKVRSRTLAMQKSDELAETAAEVFRQLIALGIEPNRLYIGIVKDETGDMEMWATDEDGTQVGKRFMFNKNENASVLKLYDGWKTQKRSVIVDMQGKELEDYFHYLNNVMHIPFKGGLTQKRRVQSVAYFSKGFIGMASPDGQGDETIQLLERFAAVFNLTFTRFNDLKLAEAHAVQAEEDLIKLQTEKKRAEDALSELQVTQKQLIQSEKMASLGELTAGIAHEIQNPLNFVNNFSDVNKELLAEMKEEIEKGNTEEVIAIANDIISNEEKINHHGKRADAIVKGMLQHSRSSSGIMEPTDINELADEYLRLAYHGLRAKDKSFNATMKTDFDEKIGKVNVIPQEIGRVFLNLITNAFYVVAEKKKQLANGYEPTVTVTTKKESDKVVVSVKDNGSGIPQKVLDKIFQPFFTTKPTGQGTGLGLSLSYDIVKAHSGEIKVKTKDGEGSEFIISLPN